MNEEEIIETLKNIANINKNNTLGMLAQNTLDEIKSGIKYKERTQDDKK